MLSMICVVAHFTRYQHPTGTIHYRRTGVERTVVVRRRRPTPFTSTRGGCGGGGGGGGVRCIGSGGGGKEGDEMEKKGNLLRCQAHFSSSFSSSIPGPSFTPLHPPPFSPHLKVPTGHISHCKLLLTFHLLEIAEKKKKSEPLFVPEEHRSKNFETCYLRNAGLRSVRVVVVLLGGQFVCSFHLNSLRGGIQFARPL